MTSTTFAALAINTTFTVSNSAEIFTKHSESLAIGEDGVKIRVTQPTRSTVSHCDIRTLAPESFTDSVVDLKAEAAKLGAKVVRDLRIHARKPFGERGVNIIVANAQKAWRAAVDSTKVTN